MANAINPWVDTGFNLVAAGQTSGEGVEFIRQELLDMLPQYDQVRDCIAGQVAVKARKIEYLPRPNPTDVSPQNNARYDAYLTRAIFYNVTKRTLAGLVGQVFLAEPTIRVPDILKPVLKDANGAGLSLEQLAQQAEEMTLSFGRAGIFIDYPNRGDKPATVAELNSGAVRPTINVYAPWHVTNWKTITVGSDTKLSLVVLQERYDKSEDEFKSEMATQYRVLKLVDGLYMVELWRKDGEQWAIYETYQPRGGNGARLESIPFMFIGSANNDDRVDEAPLYDMSVLNIGHYRNSADYEESAFMMGQPTPVVIGLTKDWYDNVMGGSINFGSRGGIPLPPDADAKLLQAEANTLCGEAMERKEKQMVALGAKLVEQKSVQRTATEAGLDEASEASTLTTITNNVSAAIKWALEWCGIYQGERTEISDGEDDTIEFLLNTDFDLSAMTMDEVSRIIEIWIKGAITDSEMRDQMVKAKVGSLDFQQYQTEIIQNAETRNIENFGNDDDEENEDDEETEDQTGEE